MSPIRASCSWEIAPTRGQCFKRVGEDCCGGGLCSCSSVPSRSRLLVFCSFPKSLAFCSASSPLGHQAPQFWLLYALRPKCVWTWLCLLLC